MNREQIKHYKELLPKIIDKKKSYYRKKAQSKCIIKTRHWARLEEAIETKYLNRWGIPCSLKNLFAWEYYVSDEAFREMMKRENPLLKMIKKDSFGGGTLVLPFKSNN